jgi:hypothetical protein
VRLGASPALRGYLDWPGAQQVPKIERSSERKGRTIRQVRDALTSLDEQTSAHQVLRHGRGCWGARIGGTLVGRDLRRRCQPGAQRFGPEGLTALRNTVIGLLRQAGWTNIAAGLRHTGWKPGAALRLLGVQVSDS